MTSKERVSTGTDQPRIHSETENKPSVGKKKEATSVRNTTTFNHYDHYNSPSSDLYLSEDPLSLFLHPHTGPSRKLAVFGRPSPPWLPSLCCLLVLQGDPVMVCLFKVLKASKLLVATIDLRFLCKYAWSDVRAFDVVFMQEFDDSSRPFAAG